MVTRIIAHFPRSLGGSSSLKFSTKNSQVAVNIFIASAIELARLFNYCSYWLPTVLIFFSSQILGSLEIIHLGLSVFLRILAASQLADTCGLYVVKDSGCELNWLVRLVERPEVFCVDLCASQLASSRFGDYPKYLF